MKFGVEGAIFGAVYGIGIGILTTYYVWRIKRKRERMMKEGREA